jgi:hypothetical protein
MVLPFLNFWTIFSNSIAVSFCSACLKNELQKKHNGVNPLHDCDRK